MTIPLSLLQRAKQGDASAIAALMNDALQSQDVRVKVALDHHCLQVMLSSVTALNQSTCITFIQRGLQHLQPDAIASVRAFAWQLGEAFPLWIAEFPVAQAPSLQGESEAKEHRTLSALVRHGLDKGAGRSQKQPTPSIVPASKSRSELFKLGLMVVLTTMVYFAVAGV